MLDPKRKKLYKDLWRFAQKYTDLYCRGLRAREIELIGLFQLGIVNREIVRTNRMIRSRINSGTTAESPILCNQLALLRRECSRLVQATNYVSNSADSENYMTSEEESGHGGPKTPQAYFRQVFSEVLALAKEHSSLTVELKPSSKPHISVTTEPITLSEADGSYATDLGEFEVHLLLSSHTPVAWAVDESDNVSGSGHPHPHIDKDGGYICFGEGNAAVTNAMREGRLADAFDITESVLTNYCADEAFCRLSNWTDISCHNCGCGVDEDSAMTCCRCEEANCPDCNYVCPECNEDVCAGCSQACRACRTRTCCECIKECTACKRGFCSECLNEYGRCETCQKTYDEDNKPAEPVAPVGEVVRHRSFQRLRDSFGRFTRAGSNAQQPAENLVGAVADTATDMPDWLTQFVEDAAIEGENNG